jgi:hypothetical protein
MSTVLLDHDRNKLLADGWAALPPEYRPPAHAPTLGEAQAWCRRLTETHYENFHVASWFLPARLRSHFHAVYAYCRVSDDLGDEVGDAAQSLALLPPVEQREGPSRCSTGGSSSWNSATRATRRIRSSSHCCRPSRHAGFRWSRSLIC